LAAACAVAAALFAVACGDSDSVTGPGGVTGVVWRLQSLQHSNGSIVSPPTSAFTLQFTSEGRLEVRADCNGCGGTYQLSGSALHVGPLPCTRVFCPHYPFDNIFLVTLEAADTVERRDDTLILRSSAGVLRFVR
jgi:heat shock protein HslJ